MSLISQHSSRLRRVARSSSAAETQAAADGDDEAVCIRLCLKEVLVGQLALVVDCRGVFDALARSSSSCLGLKDKKSGLEALALKQSLVEYGTVIRRCHSAAKLGDVVTKDSDAAHAPWDLSVRSGFRWKMIHDPLILLCFLMTQKFVVDFVELLTEEFMAYSLMLALLTLAA